jgi:hypothetical protein
MSSLLRDHAGRLLLTVVALLALWFLAQCSQPSAPGNPLTTPGAVLAPETFTTTSPGHMTVLPTGGILVGRGTYVVNR